MRFYWQLLFSNGNRYIEFSYIGITKTGFMPLRLFLKSFTRKSYRFSFVDTVSMAPSRLFFASLMEKLEQLVQKGKVAGANGLIVLLADDDADDRDMFEEAISRINPLIRVGALRNGNSLIQHLQSGEQPDMIFLDLNMPGKNGKECLAEIRKNPSWAKIPVVIYSTSASKRDVNDTYSGGANLYLLKPNSFQELIKIIKRVFSIDIAAPVAPQDYLLTYSS